MTKQTEKNLHEDRLSLVKKYLAHKAGWPDGIDTKYDRWYTGKEEHWLALAKDKPVAKPVAKPPMEEGVAKPNVTRSNVTQVVSRLKDKGGRPKLGDKPMTAAERMRKTRERRK